MSGVAVLDEEGRVLFATEALARLVAPERTGLTGESFASLFGDAGAVREALLRAKDGAMDLRAASGAPDAPPLRLHFCSFHDDAKSRTLVVASADDAAGEIAGRVKHDVNNLLMGLLGHAALLRERHELPELALRKLELIEQQGNKIRERIAGLDAIRRQGGPTR